MVKENKTQIFNDNSKQEIVSITYEEIGFFPRSFSRVLDRFLKQVFSDVENLVIQEYRFYRYLFLTTLKCLFILFFVPFLVNFFSKNYLVRPLAEFFWNTQQHEIFLNSYQQKRAFSELKNFEEKIYFESLINFTDNPKESYVSLLNNQSKNKDISLGPSYGSETDISQIINQRENFIENKPSLNGDSSLIDISQTCSLDSATKKVRKIEGEVGHVTLDINPKIKGITSSVKPGLPNEFNEKKLGIDPPSIFKNGLFDGILSPFHKVSLSIQVLPKGEENSFSNSFILDQKPTKRYSFEQRLQEKTIELAFRYNNQSIEAITNFFADLISFITLCYLLIALEIQINITKSFLLEVFFGLDDSKKSLLILLITDLLVGYHSSNLWELFFEFLFTHYGLPESQTGIFLLVATLPVLLDVLFKYLIFRHLNRSSPATVATYHAMIE